MFELFKSLHIIGFVSWFAALFYLPRLFIYHRESLDQGDEQSKILNKQFQLMESRLYNIIMTPAMWITVSCGFIMLYLRGLDWLRFNIWMHWKLLFVFCLVAYHFYCKKIMQKLSLGQATMTAMQLRFFNEITTILLLVIILLAVYKNGLNFIYAFFGIVFTILLLIMGIRFYKKLRAKE